MLIKFKSRIKSNLFCQPSQQLCQTLYIHLECQFDYEKVALKSCIQNVSLSPRKTCKSRWNNWHFWKFVCGLFWSISSGGFPVCGREFPVALHTISLQLLGYVNFIVMTYSDKWFFMNKSVPINNTDQAVRYQFLILFFSVHDPSREFRNRTTEPRFKKSSYAVTELFRTKSSVIRTCGSLYSLTRPGCWPGSDPTLYDNNTAVYRDVNGEAFVKIVRFELTGGPTSN